MVQLHRIVNSEFALRSAAFEINILRLTHLQTDRLYTNREQPSIGLPYAATTLLCSFPWQ